MMLLLFLWLIGCTTPEGHCSETCGGGYEYNSASYSRDMGGNITPARCQCLDKCRTLVDPATNEVE